MVGYWAKWAKAIKFAGIKGYERSTNSRLETVAKPLDRSSAIAVAPYTIFFLYGLHLAEEPLIPTFSPQEREEGAHLTRGNDAWRRLAQLDDILIWLKAPHEA